MALPPCSHSSGIPSTVSPCTSRVWPPHLVPGHSPHQGTQKYLPTPHLLQPGDLREPLGIFKGGFEALLQDALGIRRAALISQDYLGRLVGLPAQEACPGWEGRNLKLWISQKIQLCPSCSFCSCHVPAWSPPLSLLQHPGHSPRAQVRAPSSWAVGQDANMIFL